LAEQDILLIIQDNPVIIPILIAIVIGVIHGIYLGRRFLEKIDKRRKRTKPIVIGFTILIILVVFVNYEKFSNPTPISGTFEIPVNPDDVVIFAQNFIVERGLFGIISMILPVMVFVLGRGSEKKGVVMRFMQITGLSSTAAVMAVTILDIVPNQDAIMIFSAYQISIAIGAIGGSGFMKYMNK